MKKDEVIVIKQIKDAGGDGDGVDMDANTEVNAAKHQKFSCRL